MIACPRCHGELGPPVWNAGGLVPCPGCSAALRADVFPAARRPAPPGDAGELLVTETEAGCYAHPRKKAVRVCARCGRFMCGLCDIELNGEHLCPPCLDRGAAAGRIAGLENRRVCYDKVALYTALLSNFFIYSVVFAAPAVLFMVVRYWKQPISVVSTSRFRFVLAAGIAVLQLAAIGAWLCWKP
jgi:hypothetical protein